MFASLGRFVYRRRLPVALAWVVVLIAGLGVGGEVFGRLGTGSGLRDDAESVVVSDLLAQVGGDGGGMTGLIDGRSVDDPAFRAELDDAVRDLEAVPGVQRVTGPLADGRPIPGLVARDERAVLVRVELETGLPGGGQAQLDQVDQRLRAVDAPRVLVGGDEIAREEFQEQAQRDLERGEALALPVMLVLLLLVFRGVVAALTPLLMAAVAVAGALLILLGVSEFADISAYSVNVITMLGLGLAVDYSLLVVSRFREERAGGLGLPEAIERTLATAGRTVAFSGLTVAAALCGLLAFAEPFLRSLAWGGIGVVLVAMAAAVTLVPALLGLWGRRIRPGPAHLQSDHGVFYRLSRLVQRFAPAIVVVVAALLILLALPFRHARLENSGLESLPRSSESRQLFEAVDDRFQDGGTDPVVVVVESAPGNPLVADYLRRVEALPGVVRVEPRQGTPPQITVLDVVPEGSSEGPAATRLVERIRALERPVAAGVTGPAAFLVDYRDSLTSRLPYALGLIGLATFALLFLMTGSVVVPVKAIVMCILSLGASFGALVWVFQEGHLSGLLGFDSPGMVDITVPVLIFVFAFGLSMDYEVFLLSRIKEAWDQTGDNDLAVALGLQRTGRIVTSAAALIVVVFLGFAAGELLTIKEVGLGMAIAVVLDATVVRMLLVPATMKLMGRWNWWAPTPLRRLHDRWGLVERGPAAEPARPDDQERVGSLHAGP
ncbi:MAG TPA: MMPL family transporter [Actinomycetota bacterium]|nr:MMPL family transporter [Actinomycetota bacterium]